MDNQQTAQKINLFYDDYGNVYVLRAYFLRLTNPRYFVGYLNYLSYANIQTAAENRAYALYAHLRYSENKSLKLIAEELKRHNQ